MRHRKCNNESQYYTKFDFTLLIEVNFLAPGLKKKVKAKWDDFGLV